MRTKTANNAGCGVRNGIETRLPAKKKRRREDDDDTEDPITKTPRFLLSYSLFFARRDPDPEKPTDSPVEGAREVACRYGRTFWGGRARVGKNDASRGRGRNEWTPRWMGETNNARRCEENEGGMNESFGGRGRLNRYCDRETHVTLNGQLHSRAGGESRRGGCGLVLVDVR